MKYSMVAGLTTSGIIQSQVVEGSFDYDLFWSFIFDTLIPSMNAYPGPNSVLVLDNARIHHNVVMVDRVRLYGIRVEFLPSYSPDLQPIELFFGCMKRHLKRIGPYIHHLSAAVIDSHILLNEFATSVTSETACSWIAHCGYE